METETEIEIEKEREKRKEHGKIVTLHEAATHVIGEHADEILFNFDYTHLPECVIICPTVKTLRFSCFKKIDEGDMYIIDDFLTNIKSSDCPEIKTVVFYGSRACYANRIEWDFKKKYPECRVVVRSYCNCP